jgi:hypothetical protein
MLFGDYLEASRTYLDNSLMDVPNSSPKVQNSSRDTTCIAVCLWTSRVLKASDIWGMVRESVGLTVVLPLILKIVRVDDIHCMDYTRFDFIVKKGTGERLSQSLRVWADTLSAERRIQTGELVLKRHEQYWKRNKKCHLQEPCPRRSAILGSGINNRECAKARIERTNVCIGNVSRLCSLNVNNLKKKLGELGDYARVADLAILAVQETRFTDYDGDICMPGYRTYSVDSEKGVFNQGKVGLCTFVRDSLPSSPWGLKWKSPFHVVTVVHFGAVEYYIVNVYIPCKGTRYRAQALKDLERRLRDIVAAKSESSPIVLMGDWNMRPDEIDSKLEEMEALLCLKRLVPSGKAETYHTPNGNWSALDHVVVNGVDSRSSALVVDDKLDISTTSLSDSTYQLQSFRPVSLPVPLGT